MAKDLDNIHLRKLERPGKSRVKVTHMTTGQVVYGEGIDRAEAKFRAYAALSALLGNPGAVTAYEDAANEAEKAYFRRLSERGVDDGDF